MKEKCMILMNNPHHPWKTNCFFLMVDEDENTCIFDSEEEARIAIKEHDAGFFVYSILKLSDIEYV